MKSHLCFHRREGIQSQSNYLPTLSQPLWFLEDSSSVVLMVTVVVIIMEKEKDTSG